MNTINQTKADAYHLAQYAALSEFTPELIRYQVLNDGDDTVIFRAQDVCAAMGALDYFSAMNFVDQTHVTTISHPDTEVIGMRYTCVGREGLYQIAEAMADEDEKLSARCWSVIRWAERVLDEQAA